MIQFQQITRPSYIQLKYIISTLRSILGLIITAYFIMNDFQLYPIIWILIIFNPLTYFWTMRQLRNLTNNTLSFDQNGIKLIDSKQQIKKQLDLSKISKIQLKNELVFNDPLKLKIKNGIIKNLKHNEIDIHVGSKKYNYRFETNKEQDIQKLENLFEIWQKGQYRIPITIQNTDLISRVS